MIVLFNYYQIWWHIYHNTSVTQEASLSLDNIKSLDNIYMEGTEKEMATY